MEVLLPEEKCSVRSPARTPSPKCEKSEPVALETTNLYGRIYFSMSSVTSMNPVDDFFEFGIIGSMPVC